MNDKIVFEVMHTGTRWDYRASIRCYRDHILLYEDGSWEKIFRSKAACNITCISSGRLRGMTRNQVVTKLEDLVRSGKLEGKFLSKE